MNELIKVFEKEDGKLTVSGRELYEFLGINSNYTTWFKRMLEYGFMKGEDFIPFLEESTGGRPTHGHALSLDMAKEIAMIQRNEKGKRARSYFIEIEKRYRQRTPMSVEDIMITTLQEMKGMKSDVAHLKAKQNRQEVKIDEVLDKVTLSSKQVHKLTTTLKIRLFELVGHQVRAGDFEWNLVKKKLFKKYQVTRWEEIPVSQYYAIFADIDGMDDMRGIAF